MWNKILRVLLGTEGIDKPKKKKFNEGFAEFTIARSKRYHKMNEALSEANYQGKYKPRPDETIYEAYRRVFPNA